MRKHLQVQLELGRDTPRADIFVPPNSFPPRFGWSGSGRTTAGYFASYDGVTPDRLKQLVSEDKWTELANSTADFLIVDWSDQERRLEVLTDISGKFPCYFTSIGKTVLVSTDISQLLNQRLARSYPCTLNWDMVLDYISTGWFLFAYDETLVREIKQVPPGTLLKIDRPEEFSLQSVVDIRQFVRQQPAPLASTWEFAQKMVEVTSQAVARRLNRLRQAGWKWGAELTSGLDSGLVAYLVKEISGSNLFCYSGITTEVTTDTDARVVQQFAAKHGITTHLHNVDGVYPFGRPDLFRLYSEYPPGLTGIEEAYESFTTAAKEGVKVYFQGLGGDEVYEAHTFDFWLRYKMQEFYFLTTWRLKLGIERVLTPKGIALLLSEKRFRDKRWYGNIFASSAINANLQFFRVSWETGVWPITPFVDEQVVQFARLNLPRAGMVAPDKREIFKGKEDIFVFEQFKSKVEDREQFYKVLKKNPGWIVNVLARSRLRESGLFRIPEVVSDFSRGNISAYLDGDTAFYLIYLLRLEYFLQRNNIQIPHSEGM